MNGSLSDKEDWVTEQERVLQGWFGDRLKVQSLYEKQGKRFVFSAESETEEYRIFLSQHDECREKLWKGIIPRRERIQHRYLAPVLESGALPSGDYYWCFSLGKTFSSLEDSFAQWPQNPLHLIRLVLQSAEATVALHRKSVVHGDIRPRNIGVQISNIGAEEVLLFGSIMIFLPKEGNWPENVLRDQAVTQAPEIVSGEKIPTYASDVYSLGVLLFRSVFGSWPFEANSSFEIAAKHVTEELIFPKVRPSIAPALWEIIAQAMDKDPEKRMSCRELVELIAPFARYEEAVFGDLELTDPRLIEKPSPLQSSSILPLTEELLEEDDDAGFLELEEQDFEVLSFFEKEILLDPEEEGESPAVEKLAYITEVDVQSEQVATESDTADEIEEEIVKKPETEIKPETETIASVVIPTPEEEDALQILVGARPMPSSIDLEEEVTAKVEETSKLPVFWSENSTGTIELTGGESDESSESSEPSEVLEIKIGEEKNKSEEGAGPVEVIVELEETTHHGIKISPDLIKSSNLGEKNSKREFKSEHLSQVKFIAFMVLSAVITVLILKIFEKIF